ncbi:MAG TPA: 2Fe-2S iron-sulfur cluster-binding protein [Dehalococcoidia bacterium]|nr:2Fe-2S iron-sulfur cluster-binding protein [Dehalococcoidia bacterium]
MAKITIQPLDLVIDAEDGSTIMEAAWAHDLYWPTTCGGQGICTSCACIIEQGGNNLDDMGRSEQKRLVQEFGEAVVGRRRLRLACQARVYGEIVVQKRGVRPKGQSALSTL